MRTTRLSVDAAVKLGNRDEEGDERAEASGVIEEDDAEEAVK